MPIRITLHPINRQKCGLVAPLRPAGRTGTPWKCSRKVHFLPESPNLREWHERASTNQRPLAGHVRPTWHWHQILMHAPVLWLGDGADLFHETRDHLSLLMLRGGTFATEHARNLWPPTLHCDISSGGHVPRGHWPDALFSYLYARSTSENVAIKHFFLLRVKNIGWRKICCRLLKSNWPCIAN